MGLINAVSQQEMHDFCKNNGNSFIVLVWPIAEGKHDKIVRLLNKYGCVIYETERVLEPKVAYTILKKSHYNAPSSVTSNFKAHFKWYFPTKSILKKPTRIFVCTFDDVQQATQCKYAVRGLFNVSYRAIHINDTHAETLELGKIIFGATA